MASHDRKRIVQYIIHHVVLPPQLPQSREAHYAEDEVNLLHETSALLDDFKEYSPPQYHQACSAVGEMLATWFDMVQGASIDTLKLTEALHNMTAKGKPKSPLIFENLTFRQDSLHSI